MSRHLDFSVRKEILRRDNYTCRYCGDKRGPFHMDHVYPYVKGGETTIDNLVTACEACNQSKHDTIGMWPKPIGHFENKARNTPYILMVATIGVMAIAQGAITANKGFHTAGQIVFVAGLMLAFMSLGYLLTKRWE